MKDSNDGESIFVPQGSNNFELCQPQDPEDFETITRLMNGEPRKSTWAPISMRIVRKNMGKTLALSDSPWLGPWALIFRPKVIESMGQILQEYGELLLLNCPDSELYIYNSTRIVDALDESDSDLARYDDTRIMGINRYSFRPKAVLGTKIFKIKSLQVSPVFVAKSVVDAWKSNRLKGITFRKVWSPSHA